MSELKSLEKIQVSSLAKVLFLVGGILLIVAGALRIVELQTLLDLSPTLRNVASISSIAGGILAIVVGVIALLGTRQVASPSWNIVLLILGLVASGLGGILVLLGSIIGLVSIYVKS
jgi:hypothetical protein